MIAEADRFVKRKIRKRRRKALTAENYGGTLFHGENMPSNRISPILDGIRQKIAVTVKLQGLFGMLTMPLNSHLDYEQWYPHAAHVGRSLTGVLHEERDDGRGVSGEDHDRPHTGGLPRTQDA